jgi:hypothetical protein
LSWLRDDAKPERVRARMAGDDLGALVVRTPDNVLYLSTFLPMKACGARRVGQAGVAALLDEPRRGGRVVAGRETTPPRLRVASGSPRAAGLITVVAQND